MRSTELSVIALQVFAVVTSHSLTAATLTRCDVLNQSRRGCPCLIASEGMAAAHITQCMARKAPNLLTAHTMAPLPSLALELIFEQLVHDAPTLADCALVSRGWADPAQRALFGRRTFHIGRTADQLAYDRPARVSKFCVEAFTDMLVAAPHLAGHVRRLFFDMGDATKRAGPTVTVAEITRPLVEWRLTNLVSLELSGYASCRIVPMTGIDEALAAGLPMLTHLRIHETRLRSFSTLQCIACSLPSLQSLSLSRIHWNPDLPGPSAPIRGLDTLRLLEFELGHLIREDGDEYMRMHKQLFAWLLHTPSTRSLRKITLDTDCRCQGEEELVRTVGMRAHGLHLHLKNYGKLHVLRRWCSTDYVQRFHRSLPRRKRRQADAVDPR
jgi:hypothetical protein